MKKLCLLAMVCFAVTTFIGCSKDDDAPEVNPEQIVGTWLAVRNVGFEIDSSGNKDEWDENLTSEKMLWIFNANGTGKSYPENYPADLYVFTYSISGQSLVFHKDDHNDTYVIKKLDSSELILHEYEKSKDGEYSEIRYYIRK